MWCSFLLHKQILVAYRFYFLALPQGMWDPSSLSRKFPLNWKHRVLSTGPPGNAHHVMLLTKVCFQSPSSSSTGQMVNAGAWTGQPRHSALLHHHLCTCCSEPEYPSLDLSVHCWPAQPLKPVLHSRCSGRLSQMTRTRCLYPPHYKVTKCRDCSSISGCLH